MEQVQSPDNSPSNGSPNKNNFNFSAKNKGVNFANFHGVNPAKSLHSPSTNTLIASLKGKP